MTFGKVTTTLLANASFAFHSSVPREVINKIVIVDDSSRHSAFSAFKQMAGAQNLGSGRARSDEGDGHNGYGGDVNDDSDETSSFHSFGEESAAPGESFAVSAVHEAAQEGAGSAEDGQSAQGKGHEKMVVVLKYSPSAMAMSDSSIVHQPTAPPPTQSDKPAAKEPMHWNEKFAVGKAQLDAKNAAAVAQKTSKQQPRQKSNTSKKVPRKTGILPPHMKASPYISGFNWTGSGAVMSPQASAQIPDSLRETLERAGVPLSSVQDRCLVMDSLGPELAATAPRGLGGELDMGLPSFARQSVVEKSVAPAQIPLPILPPDSKLPLPSDAIVNTYRPPVLVSNNLGERHDGATVASTVQSTADADLSDSDDNEMHNGASAEAEGIADQPKPSRTVRFEEHDVEYRDMGMDSESKLSDVYEDMYDLEQSATQVQTPMQTFSTQQDVLPAWDAPVLETKFLNHNPGVAWNPVAPPPERAHNGYVPPIFGAPASKSALPSASSFAAAGPSKPVARSIARAKATGGRGRGGKTAAATKWTGSAAGGVAGMTKTQGEDEEWYDLGSKPKAARETGARAVPPAAKYAAKTGTKTAAPKTVARQSAAQKAQDMVAVQDHESDDDFLPSSSARSGAKKPRVKKTHDDMDAGFGQPEELNLEVRNSRVSVPVRS